MRGGCTAQPIRVEFVKMYRAHWGMWTVRVVEGVRMGEGRGEWGGVEGEGLDEG